MPGNRDSSNADGAGALLGAAAADQRVAIQGSPLDGEPLYGFHTQLATIVAYHLLRWGAVSTDGLRTELLEMAFSSDGPSVYRGEPAWFQAFLRQRSPVEQAGAGAAVGTIPVGLWHRWDARLLIRDAASAALATHRDALSVAAACVYAGAVAAASFGQQGRDLINGIHELATEVERYLAEEHAHLPSQLREASDLTATLANAHQWLGSPAGDLVRAAAAELGDAGLVVGALVLGADGRESSVEVIEDVLAGDEGAVVVGPLVGGIVGARRGLAHWPWRMPNEHWFAEIGRRMVAQARSFEDLPDPYAVELHLVDTEEAGRPH